MRRDDCSDYRWKSDYELREIRRENDRYSSDHEEECANRCATRELDRREEERRQEEEAEQLHLREIEETRQRRAQEEYEYDNMDEQ